ncbi:MAG: PHP domain-containing protein [Clostridia bacterium]|nr:PHP domain-containing protein [Clostridia bacterium]
MFKYELHMHTSEASACGKNTVDEMIRKYHSLGFSGAVITNHFFHGNTRIDRTLPPEEFVRQFCAPFFEGQKTAKELDFDLLFGLEENYGSGKEFLVYGITPQFLLEHTYLFAPEMNKPPYREEMLAAWRREADKCGAVIAFAHPYRDRPYIKDPGFVPDRSLFDAVEVFNLCNRPEDNARAAEEYENSDKILIAGSDLHHTDFDVASGVAFSHRVRDEIALATALKKGDFELVLPKI